MGNLDNITNAVVKVNTASGSGSGFYVKKHNLIVTNHHVVQGSRSVGIELALNETKIAAQVVLVNPLIDIAFLKPTRILEELPEIQFQRTARETEPVYVMGYPLGFPFTVTEGTISSTRQTLRGLNYIQTSAAVNPGNSGGPLVNSSGEVIGVTTAKIMEAENMGYALPIDNVSSELETFLQNPNTDFAVKCPHCSHSIYEKTENCPNCGGRLDETLFAEEPRSPLAVFVEDVFKELNLDPVIARQGREFWEFHQGSALVRIFVFKNNYLFATSPLAKLPKTNLSEVYSYILSDPVKPYLMGIHEGMVFISYRVHLSDLQGSFKSQILHNLANLALKADEMDNYLIEKYGCEWTEKSKKA